MRACQSDASATKLQRGFQFRTNVTELRVNFLRTTWANLLSSFLFLEASRRLRVFFPIIVLIQVGGTQPQLQPTDNKNAAF